MPNRAHQGNDGEDRSSTRNEESHRHPSTATSAAANLGQRLGVQRHPFGRFSELGGERLLGCAHGHGFQVGSSSSVHTSMTIDSEESFTDTTTGASLWF
jgi:hypothetical protein